MKALIFGVAFALGLIAGSSSISSVSSSTANTVEFPNCQGTTSFIEDGFCDASNNNVECGYDGGDCCGCTCISTPSFACGRFSFDCVDPTAGENILGCEVVWSGPLAVSACAAGPSQSWVVETAADAYSLAESTLCSGGNFQVEWKGYVPMNRTLYAINGTVVSVVGLSSAVADGGEATQLFAAINGSFRVSDMEMRDGAGFQGGAISATHHSDVTLTRVNFRYNSADGLGGAIYLDDSALELVDSSTFTGNSAKYGGAVFMGSTSTLTQRVGSGDTYRFTDNNALDGGAWYVCGTSNVVAGIRQQTTSTSSYTLSSPRDVSSGGSSSGTVKGCPSNIDAAIDGARYPTMDATFAKACFINNTVQGSGGAVYLGDSSKWLWEGETIFEGNSAEDGGAIFMEDWTSVDWQGVTLFSQNRASGDGGAVATDVDISYAYISLVGELSFLNNTCGNNGGALALFGDICLYWGYATPEFSGNFAAFFGGAVYSVSSSYGQEFANALFIENEAQVRMLEYSSYIVGE